MSLVKVESVQGNDLHVSGIDLVDGTPVLDIKPYIRKYDDPDCFEVSKQIDETSLPEGDILKVTQSPFESLHDEVAEIEFSPSCLNALSLFHGLNPAHINCDHCLEHMKSDQEVKSAICNILKSDPRSRYRKERCSDRMYFFSIDKVHVTSWFDTETGTVHVLKVKAEESVKKVDRVNTEEIST